MAGCLLDGGTSGLHQSCERADGRQSQGALAGLRQKSWQPECLPHLLPRRRGCGQAGWLWIRGWSHGRQGHGARSARRGWWLVAGGCWLRLEVAKVQCRAGDLPQFGGYRQARRLDGLRGGDPTGGRREGGRFGEDNPDVAGHIAGPRRFESHRQTLDQGGLQIALNRQRPGWQGPGLRGDQRGGKAGFRDGC